MNYRLRGMGNGGMNDGEVGFFCSSFSLYIYLYSSNDHQHPNSINNSVIIVSSLPVDDDEQYTYMCDSNLKEATTLI